MALILARVGFMTQLTNINTLLKQVLHVQESSSIQGFLIEIDEKEYPYMSDATLLYTSFTNQIIYPLNFILKFDDKAKFSMPPNSPDCDIFVMREYDDKLLISIYRPGETT